MSLALAHAPAQEGTDPGQPVAACVVGASLGYPMVDDGVRQCPTMGRPGVAEDGDELPTHPMAPCLLLGLLGALAPPGDDERAIHGVARRP